MIFSIKHHPETIMEYLILKCSQLLFEKSEEDIEVEEDKEKEVESQNEDLNYPQDNLKQEQ